MKLFTAVFLVYATLAPVHAFKRGLGVVPTKLSISTSAIGKPTQAVSTSYGFSDHNTSLQNSLPQLLKKTARSIKAASSKALSLIDATSTKLFAPIVLFLFILWTKLENWAFPERKIKNQYLGDPVQYEALAAQPDPFGVKKKFREMNIKLRKEDIDLIAANYKTTIPSTQAQAQAETLKQSGTISTSKSQSLSAAFGSSSTMALTSSNSIIWTPHVLIVPPVYNYMPTSAAAQPTPIEDVADVIFTDKVAGSVDSVDTVESDVVEDTPVGVELTPEVAVPAAIPIFQQQKLSDAATTGSLIAGAVTTLAFGPLVGVAAAATSSYFVLKHVSTGELVENMGKIVIDTVTYLEHIKDKNQIAPLEHDSLTSSPASETPESEPSLAF